MGEGGRAEGAAGASNTRGGRERAGGVLLSSVQLDRAGR